MAAMPGDDQPGAERSRRRTDDCDSELEDALLQENFLPGKKNSDLSDEELNGDLLQSDEEEHDQQNYSGHGVTVNLNATAGGMSSFELSENVKEESVTEEPEYEEGDNEAAYEEVEEPKSCVDDFTETYEENDAELTEGPTEYGDEETVDEVLKLEITKPLDDFQEDDYLQSYKIQKVQEEQQQFIPHAQPNMQGPIQSPIQQLHQHHHLAGQPKSPMSMQQQTFNLRSQNSSNRIQGQLRQGPPKLRQGTQMVPNQQTQHACNSNLCELPIAPSHSLDMDKKRPAPDAQVKPIGTIAPKARSMATRNSQEAKQINVTNQVKEEVKVEQQFPDEDEETRIYLLKIEEQKRLREEFLKRKELRRQQQAEAKKKELLKRLSQQLPGNAQVGQTGQEKQPMQVANNGNPIMDLPDTANSPPKIPLLQPTPGANIQFQGQQKKFIKQTVQNRVAGESQFQKVQQVRPAVSTVPPQTMKVASIQEQQQEQRPGAKRTLMQGSNSGDVNEPHIPSKVRVIKISR